MSAQRQPQHLIALESANRVRLTRSAAYRPIRALPWIDGRREVAKLLLDPPEWLEGEQILRLLLVPHRMGRTRARKLLVPDRIGELRRVGDLTPRQRRSLAMRLAPQPDEREAD